MVYGGQTIEEPCVFEELGLRDVLCLLRRYLGQTDIEWVRQQRGEEVAEEQKSQPHSIIGLDLIIVELVEEVR